MKIVIDTNVVISGIFFNGKPRRVIESVCDAELEAYASPEIIGEPFVLTLLKDESELIDVLSARADYTVEEGDPLPVVYKNDKILGELRK